MVAKLPARHKIHLFKSAPYFSPLATSTVKDTPWPYFLSERQHYEQSGYRDLASSLGPTQSKDQAYPDLENSNLKNKYLDFLNLENLHRNVEKKINITEANILFTRGVTEAIDLTFRTFCRPKLDRVVITPPSFPLFYYWAHYNNVDVTEIPLNGDRLNELNIESVKEANPKLCMLCSPNNPTAQSLSLKSIEDVAKINQNCIIAIDESYGEYSDTPSAVNLIEKYPNIIVFRSFSKAWSMAGLRVGAIIAKSDIINSLRFGQGPFAIPSHCGERLFKALLKTNDLFNKVKLVRIEVDFFTAQLKQLKNVLHIFPTSANFVCVKFKNSDNIKEFLLKKKILIESVPYPLDDYVRISVRHRDDSIKLLDIFRQLETDNSTKARNT